MLRQVLDFDEDSSSRRLRLAIAAGLRGESGLGQTGSDTEGSTGRVHALAGAH